jgi:hypothetical protein
MGKLKDIWLIVLDLVFVWIVATGIYLWVRLGIFYNEHPISFIGVFAQFVCFYLWIRVRTISEILTQKRVYQVNFYGLFFSIIQTLYATVILFFSYKDK